jgi:hypothetical protein
MKSLFILLIMFTLCLKISNAAEGCMVGNTVYPSFVGYSAVNLVPLSLGTKMFSNTTSYSTTVGTCPGYAVVTANTGSCIYGPATVSIVLGTYPLAVCVACPTGTLVNYNYVLCDLDDHSWVFGLAAGAFGLIVIRRRKLL